MPTASRPWLARVIRLRGPLGLAIVLIATLLVAASPLVRDTDHALRSLRDGWRQTPASGRVVVVEVDGHSTASVGSWPWPRRLHAQAIDRLMAGGAERIAFDVEFSATSAPADDQQLADALVRAGGGVILPTFRQAASAPRTRFIDFQPAAIFRDHAFIGAVSILPDRDGTVRSAPTGIVTGGLPRPSLSALVAGRDAAIDQAFPIDFAIDPATIPRISFIDLIEGRVAPERIRGKRVIIGATAIELGDRYVVPRSGVIPGVLIQALAAETLLDGRALISIPVLVPLGFAALVGLVMVTRRRLARSWWAALAASVVTLLAATAAEAMWVTSVEIVPALLLLGATSALCSGLAALDRARELRRRRRGSGLLNRVALRQDHASADAVTLVALSITNYHGISSSLGPAGTDRMLQRVVDRIELFTDGAPVYLTQDQVLCWSVTGVDVETLEDRFRGLAQILLRPIDCAGRAVDLNVALGVAEGFGSDADQVAAQAALAALDAHAAGQLWQQFSTERHGDDAWRLSLMGSLSQALLNGELFVQYQPKLAIASGRILGAEALVRWRHPERGPLSPDLFIPLAEESNRIEELTLFVIRTALDDLKRWHTAGHRLSVAVNISAKLLGSDPFVDAVRRLIAAADISTEYLVFEVTESAAMTNRAAALATLATFREMGIALSLDDYGTGQSTLSYLKELPVSELKIDKSFVASIATSPNDRVLVGSTIQMARQLGLRVVAEGIEDEACLAVLRELGCDIAQGWLIGKPMPATDLQALAGSNLRQAA